MKTGKLLSALAVACVLTIPLKAQKWEKLAPIAYSGAVTNIAVNEQGKLYVTTGDMLYHSTDEGRSWLPMFDVDDFRGNLTDVATVPGKPNALYLGSDWAMYSTSNGVNWNSQSFEVNSHTGMGGGVGSIVIHPPTGNILPAPYVVRPNGSWQRALPGKFLQNYTILQDGSVIAMEGNYAEGKIYKSTNGGFSWAEIATLPTGMGTLHLDKNGRLYAFLQRYDNATLTYHEYFSENGGASWEPFVFKTAGLPQNTRPFILDIDKNTNAMYAEVSATNGAATGVFVSKDGMQSWQLLHEGLRDVKAYEFAFIGEKVFMVTQHHGVLVYDAAAQTLEARNNGFTSRNHMPVVVASDNSIYAYDHEGIRKTADGANWQILLNNGKPINAQSLFETSGGVLFAGTIARKGEGTVLMRSADGGATWTSFGDELMSENANWSRAQQIAGDNMGNLYVQIDNSGDLNSFSPLYISSDNGVTFKKIFDRENDTTIFGANYTILPNGNILAVGLTMGLVQRYHFSSDRGTTWTERAAPGFAFGSQIPRYRAGTDGTLYTISGNKAYRSTDNALNWSEMNLPQIPHDIYFDKTGAMYLVFKRSDDQYAPATGILRSRDGGVTFEDISGDLPDGENDGIVTMNFTKENMPVVTLAFGRILRMTEATSVDENPIETSTTAAYPNPFKNSFSVDLNLLKDANVQVKMYDVVGNEIATKNFGFKTSGTQTLMLETPAVPAGMYTYRIFSGEQMLLSGAVIKE